MLGWDKGSAGAVCKGEVVGESQLVGGGGRSGVSWSLPEGLEGQIQTTVNLLRAEERRELGEIS